MLILCIFVIFNIGIDTYIYNILRHRFKSRRWAWLQLASAILLFILIVVAAFLPRRSCSNEMLRTIMWLIFTYISFYIPKYIFVILDLIASIPRLFGFRRIKLLSVAGALLAIFSWVFLWWGALINRHQLQVKEETVLIESLPEQFDGYKIVQLSDLHTGTFGNDTAFVSSLVEKINSLHPDAIFFTGDIVNSKSDELSPFTSILSRLEAPDGVYSILGNHDYGDYSDWKSPQAKEENLERLKQMQRDMGWHLLLNQTEMLRKGSDSIAIIGVENIGDPPFKVYGSLKKAYPDCSDGTVKILLSHNPAHWTDSIARHENMNIALTLAGHTHAMQIELLGWSPAKYRYPTWGGLYDDKEKAGNHQLYVNIGSGTVGFPARIGATPEITLITLRRK